MINIIKVLVNTPFLYADCLVFRVGARHGADLLVLVRDVALGLACVVDCRTNGIKLVVLIQRAPHSQIYRKTFKIKLPVLGKSTLRARHAWKMLFNPSHVTT